MVRLLGGRRSRRPQKNEGGAASGESFRQLIRGMLLATLVGVWRGVYLVVFAMAACGQETGPGAADAGPPQPPATDAAPVAQGDEPRGPVAINEVASDSPGGQADWIELRLPAGASAAVDLGGHYLTDAPDRLDHFYRFPEGTTLAPGAYLVVFADDGAAGPAGTHHAPFKLGREDGVFVMDPDGVVLDSLLYLGLKNGKSLARQPDGSGRFYSAEPTPGTVNP